MAESEKQKLSFVGGVAVDNVRTLMTLRKAVVKRAQADEVAAALAVPARR